MPRRKSERFRGIVMRPDEFLHDPNVRRMNLAERGAYFSIMFGSYELPEGGEIEDDDALLASLAICSSEEWAKVRPAVERAFDTKSRKGYWIHRSVRERVGAQDVFKKARKAQGGHAAKVRWDKRKDAASNAPSIVRGDVVMGDWVRGDSVSSGLSDGVLGPSASALAAAAGRYAPNLAAAFGLELMCELEMKYPELDMVLIAEKCLDHKLANPPSALRGFAKTAHDRGFDLKHIPEKDPPFGDRSNQGDPYTDAIFQVGEEELLRGER